MKRLIEEVRRLNKPATDEDVQRLVTHLDAHIEKGHNISLPVLEAVVKHYKKKRTDILSKDLLEWMNENEIDTFENDDVRVSVKTYVSAKMENPELGFEWLKARQYGDLIKTSVDFPKGEFTAEAQSALENMGLSFTMKEGVHPQTLKKVVSDRLEAGEDLPDEVDGIRVHYHDECAVKEK